MKILVFDIGGTHIRYAVMDGSGVFLERGKADTPQEDRNALIRFLQTVYEGQEGLDGIAISVPGIIDPEKGYCKMGGALRYNDDFYLREAVEQACSVPVHIENNAKCAAMAEAASGSLKDVADGMALFFDRMIGGGLIRGHKLFRGAHFSAGEVAYVVTVRDDMPDLDTVWGNRCGLPRLLRMYARAKRVDEARVTTAVVMEAAESGDRDAAACLDTFTREIAVQIFNLQTILDVERFAIGGEAGTYSIFMEAVSTNLGELYAVCPYDIPRAEIVACAYQENASLIGALQCYLNSNT